MRHSVGPSRHIRCPGQAVRAHSHPRSVEFWAVLFTAFDLTVSRLLTSPPHTVSMVTIGESPTRKNEKCRRERACETCFGRSSQKKKGPGGAIRLDHPSNSNANLCCSGRNGNSWRVETQRLGRKHRRLHPCCCAAAGQVQLAIHFRPTPDARCVPLTLPCGVAASANKRKEQVAFAPWPGWLGHGPL